MTLGATRLSKLAPSASSCCGSRRTAPQSLRAARKGLPSDTTWSSFAFSSFKKISCAKPARRWPRYSCGEDLREPAYGRAISSPAQYCGLRLRRGTRIRELSEERGAAENSPGCTSAASKRLHSWMGGRVCLASPRTRAACRSSTRFTPCTCSSARRRPRSTRCGAPSAPDRSCPQVAL